MFIKELEKRFKKEIEREIEKIKDDYGAVELLSDYSCLRGYMSCLVELGIIDEECNLEINNPVFRVVFENLSKEELNNMLDKIVYFGENFNKDGGK